MEYKTKRTEVWFQRTRNTGSDNIEHTQRVTGHSIILSVTMSHKLNLRGNSSPRYSVNFENSGSRKASKKGHKPKK